MTCEQKIDAMISMLEMAKEEIHYAQKYYGDEKKDPFIHHYGRKGFYERKPNLKYIKENLMQVYRASNILRHNIEVGKEEYLDKEN